MCFLDSQYINTSEIPPKKLECIISLGSFQILENNKKSISQTGASFCFIEGTSIFVKTQQKNFQQIEGQFAGNSNKQFKQNSQTISSLCSFKLNSVLKVKEFPSFTLPLIGWILSTAIQNPSNWFKGQHREQNPVYHLNPKVR